MIRSGTLWRSGITYGHVIVSGNSASADAIALALEHGLLREGRIAGSEATGGGFVLIGESGGLDLTQIPAQTGQLAVETVYQVTADAAGVFGSRRALVKAALMTDGRDTYTEEEARKVIKMFKQKEVK